MGHFSHNCKLTHVPITGGPATLIVMKPTGRMYDNSDESLKTYGKTYLCSNDGPRMKYSPVWLPIHGQYDTYGGLENIVEDDNTKTLEKYYNLKIQEIVNIITSGRKDDGYDDALNKVKKKGKDEYGKPNYQERYKELITYSGMWIHGDVYKELSNDKGINYFNQMDLGTPELLEVLGFKETGKSTDERYNRVFTKGSLSVNSDGTWINVKKHHIYKLEEFKQYVEKMGESIDIQPWSKMSRAEQTLRLKANRVIMPVTKEEREELNNLHEQVAKDADKGIAQEIYDRISYLMDKLIASIGGRTTDSLRYLMNHDEYKVTNPMSKEYLEVVKGGKLIEDFAKFWKFDEFMYATGSFYEVVGTGPQDGDHEAVKKVLDAGMRVLNEQLKERASWNEE